MVVSSVSHQTVNQIWQIFLRTVDLYRSGVRKSVLQGRNENNSRKVYSSGLWICLPWDFCASFWDCPENRESHGKTVRLKRSVKHFSVFNLFGCTIWAKNPIIILAQIVFEVRIAREPMIHFWKLNVVIKTLNLVISPCCFEEYSKKEIVKCIPHLQHNYFPSLNQ